MTKSQYPYPPDEFDVRGPEGAPVGVHREPRSGWSSVWPFLLVAVVFAGLAVGIVSFLSNDDDSTNPPVASEQSAGTESSEGAAEEPTDGESPAEGDAEETEEPADETSEEPSDEASDEAAEMPGDAAAANLGARVTVWNDIDGDGAAGQAGAGQSALSESGFTDVEASDAGEGLEGVYDATTVLYGADRADTATAVAEALGVDPANVQESDDVTNHATDAVWVILKEPVG